MSIFRRNGRIWAGASAALVLAACTASDGVERVETRHPAPLTLEQSSASIQLSRVVLDIRRGTTIGGYIAGLTCFPPYDDITMAQGRGLLRDGELVAIFRTEMRRIGYEVVDRLDDLFETAGRRPARLQFGARIRSLQVALCRRRDFFTYRSLGVAGEAAIEVEWQVFDPELHRIVYRTITRGWAERGGDSSDDGGLIVQDAFAAAAVNLAADADLRALLIQSGRPSRIFGPEPPLDSAPPEGDGARPLSGSPPRRLFRSADDDPPPVPDPTAPERLSP